MFDLNTEHFSEMTPVTVTFALSGRGRGAIEDILFFESARKARSFSIFFGRGSLEVRSSFARFPNASIN